MPIRRPALTAMEVVLAREACEPVLSSVTHRLLRGGFAEYVKFRWAYAKECERAVASAKPTSTGLPSTGVFQPPPPQTMRVAPVSAATAHPAGLSSSSSAPTQQIRRRRINPEGLKGVFAQSGVLLTSDDYAATVLAYSDPVGFVLADDLLEALHPCRQAPPALTQSVSEVVLSTFFSTLLLPCVAVTMDSVRDALSAVFAAELSREEESAVDVQTAADQLSALVVAQADVKATFTSTVYAEGAAVPCDDVTTFIVLTLQQHPCLSAIMPARCSSVAASLRLVPAPSPLGQGAASPIAASTASGTSGPALFSIRHTGSTTQRKFERYEEDKDRRDEWIRGREEADARSTYMCHAAGYGGHLPEYQYHFGRTFHVIEEDLPQLTKPKPPLEPVPADWYGPGVELKDSRMNAHHYQLA
ncbi:conserved hypothetical protein [Leishmania major strain Friedlin]|uniref:Uncharacterized protein n=1 Tax=Leishmania major TaxID=5664 RepID=Q4QA35_LEIMA|nr:conserved hypothetical protein [Leishmania major strain Friedlin]CAG9575070.1 hypothetical_protein_-_conserved [Leishmania major strain Friedlin]CAJ04821.1 conserved hypothetical protein [Leishmania major strain Friedlin]|eukprot:XP_001683813.1 conserved hypothetical protein [Leishmania major strain Friedlin]